MNATGTVGWAPEPQTRGTIGLIWSCLATIFLCTWNAVHPNLPAQDESALQIFWRRVQDLLGALVAPEWTCLQALQDFSDARETQRRSPEGKWPLAQSFYLLMGGFVIKRDDETICLAPSDIITLLESEVLDWPEKTEADILDHSKADWVLKSLALIQVIWFVTQVLGRAAQGLSVTTLELFTLGTISCALVMYVAWWAKPFDVRRPTTIEPKERLPQDIKVVRRVKDRHPTAIGDAMIPTFLAALVTILFGVLHLVGWRFHYPTDIEMWLWRASSVACVTLPLLIVGLANLTESDFVHEWIGFPVLAMYTLCRLYMMVEMFASLRAVPADVYKTPQWSQYFPSFG